MPLFWGRGVFNYSFGLLPKRKPIRSVVGVPIDCPKVEEPTQAQIDEFHQKYCDGLQAIWDKYKDKYALNRKSSLKFTDSSSSKKHK